MNRRSLLLSLLAVAAAAVVYRATGGLGRLRGLLDAIPARHIVYMDGDWARSDVFVVSTRPILGTPLPPVALAAGPDHEFACGPTADGRVVFTRITSAGGDILVVNADGTGETPVLASGNDERCEHVTPDGWVLFSLVGATGIGALQWVPLAGGTYQRVTAGAVLDEHYAATAPDGRTIFLRGTLDGRYSIGSVNGVGAQPVLLVDAFSLAFGDSFPVFRSVTKDNRVVYSWGLNLFSIKTDGSGPAALTTSLNEPRQEGNVLCGETSDGRLIFTHRYSHDVFGVRSEPRGTIYAVHTDGTGLATLQPSVAHYDDSCGGLSGDQAVFERRVGRTDLFALALDGSGTETLLRTEPGVRQDFARATPSGRVLFYRSDATSSELWSVWPDGSNPLKLASATPILSVAGLLGESVLYYTYTGGIAREIWRVDAGGGTPVPIAVSPSPKRLAFVF